MEEILWRYRIHLILRGLPVKEDAIWFKFPTHRIALSFELSFQTGKERAFSTIEPAMVTFGQQRNVINKETVTE